MMLMQAEGQISLRQKRLVDLGLVDVASVSW